MMRRSSRSSEARPRGTSVETRGSARMYADDDGATAASSVAASKASTNGPAPSAEPRRSEADLSSLSSTSGGSSDGGSADGRGGGGVGGGGGRGRGRGGSQDARTHARRDEDDDDAGEAGEADRAAGGSSRAPRDGHSGAAHDADENAGEVEGEGEGEEDEEDVDELEDEGMDVDTPPSSGPKVMKGRSGGGGGGGGVGRTAGSRSQSASRRRARASSASKVMSQALLEAGRGTSTPTRAARGEEEGTAARPAAAAAATASSGTSPSGTSTPVEARGASTHNGDVDSEAEDKGRVERRAARAAEDAAADADMEASSKERAPPTASRAESAAAAETTKARAGGASSATPPTAAAVGSSSAEYDEKKLDNAFLSNRPKRTFPPPTEGGNLLPQEVDKFLELIEKHNLDAADEEGMARSVTLLYQEWLEWCAMTNTRTTKTKKALIGEFARIHQGAYGKLRQQRAMAIVQGRSSGSSGSPAGASGAHGSPMRAGPQMVKVPLTMGASSPPAPGGGSRPTGPAAAHAVAAPQGAGVPKTAMGPPAIVPGPLPTDRRRVRPGPIVVVSSNHDRTANPLVPVPVAKPAGGTPTAAARPSVVPPSQPRPAAHPPVVPPAQALAGAGVAPRAAPPAPPPPPAVRSAQPRLRSAHTSPEASRASPIDPERAAAAASAAGFDPYSPRPGSAKTLPPGLFDMMKAHIRAEILQEVEELVRTEVSDKLAEVSRVRELAEQNRQLRSRVEQLEQHADNLALWIHHLAGPQATSSAATSSRQRGVAGAEDDVGGGAVVPAGRGEYDEAYAGVGGGHGASATRSAPRAYASPPRDVRGAAASGEETWHSYRRSGGNGSGVGRDGGDGREAHHYRHSTDGAPPAYGDEYSYYPGESGAVMASTSRDDDVAPRSSGRGGLPGGVHRVAHAGPSTPSNEVHAKNGLPTSTHRGHVQRSPGQSPVLSHRTHHHHQAQHHHPEAHAHYVGAANPHRHAEAPPLPPPPQAPSTGREAASYPRPVRRPSPPRAEYRGGGGGGGGASGVGSHGNGVRIVSGVPPSPSSAASPSGGGPTSGGYVTAAKAGYSSMMAPPGGSGSGSGGVGGGGDVVRAGGASSVVAMRGGGGEAARGMLRSHAALGHGHGVEEERMVKRPRYIG